MAKTITKPIFFLPVESTPRELDYKLNIARFICKEGWDVLIGNPPFIRDELKYKNYKGAFLEKGVNPEPEYYKKLKDKGILLYCLSDEGAASPVHSLKYKPVVETLKLIKYIFLWGKYQKENLMELCSDRIINDKYKIVGYPSFDLSYPKFKRYHLSLKHKTMPDKYILINTNFGAHNGFSFKEILEVCPLHSPFTRDFIEKSYKREEKAFKQFYESLKILLEIFKDETFLLRPHPVEKISRYKEYFRNHNNLIISDEGNINQAISSAKLVIHNDCTSALQSYLMNVPVISLAKIGCNKKNNSSVNELKSGAWPYSFGASPTTIHDAIKIIKYVLKTGRFKSYIKNKIDRKAQDTLDNLFNGCNQSTSKLLSVILTDLKIVQKDFISYELKDSRKLILKIKMFIRAFLPLHYQVPEAARKSLSKFTKKDILKRLNLLDSIEYSDFSYSIKKVFPNTFLITKN